MNVWNEHVSFLMYPKTTLEPTQKNSSMSTHLNSSLGILLILTETTADEHHGMEQRWYISVAYIFHIFFLVVEVYHGGLFVVRQAGPVFEGQRHFIMAMYVFSNALV